MAYWRSPFVFTWDYLKARGADASRRARDAVVWWTCSDALWHTRSAGIIVSPYKIVNQRWAGEGFAEALMLSTGKRPGMIHAWAAGVFWPTSVHITADTVYFFCLNIHINLNVLLLKGFIKHIPADNGSHSQYMTSASLLIITTRHSLTRVCGWLRFIDSQCLLWSVCLCSAPWSKRGAGIMV